MGRRAQYKYCPGCDRILSLSSFGMYTKNKKKYRNSECKECARARAKRYRELHPDKAKEYKQKHREELLAYAREYNKTYRLTHTQRERSADRQLRSKYGISLDDYNRMLEEQGGGCAICGKTPSNRRLHVDHDHKTGKVRGLTCYKCNVGLGYFGDDPERTRRATEYLERYQGDSEQSLPNS